MSAPILPRLLWRPATVWNVVLGASLALGLLLAVRGIRSGVAPIADESQWVEFATGVIVFVGAITVAGWLAFSVFELLQCGFSAGLPALRRRARTEMLTFAAVLAIGAGVFGAYFGHGVRDGAVLAALAALGFGLGIFSSDPHSRRRKGHAFVLLLVLLLVAVEVPEFAAWSRAAPYAVLPPVFALAALLVVIPFRAARLRAHAAMRTADMDLAYRELDLRSGQWGWVRKAPRDGAAPASAPRRSDWDWARATLHESQGFVRGGWLGAGVARALIATVCMLVAHAILGWKQFPTADAWERLGRSLDDAGSFFGPHYTLAIWVVLVCIGAPVFPVQDVHRPTSRARRGRIAWLVTAVEDAVFTAALLAVIVLVSVVLAILRPETRVDPSWPSWCYAVLVVVALSPLVRWARMRFLDTVRGNPGPVRQGIVTGIAVGVLLGVTLILHFAWVHARTPQRALHIAMVVLVLVILRWAWFVALHRHARTRDLAT